MSFNFSTTVPAAANNPSNDQPVMLQNNVSTNGILAIDHVSFNTLGGGQHKQVTFNGKNVPGAQTDPQSVLYTNSGTASSISELFFAIQGITLLVSSIKAFGYFDAAGNLLNGYNMSNATILAGNAYQLNVTSGAITGNNFLILGMTVNSSSAFPLVARGSITAGGVPNISFSTPATSGVSNFATSFAAIILQA